MTVIAIDGPAGAGKSTVARGVARRLGFTFLDTGAMYRAIALAVLREGVDPGSATEVAQLARDAVVSLRGEEVRLNGEDVSRAVRDPAVDRIVSRIAAQPAVRAAMLEAQRAAAAAGDVVIEGRDIGSVVVPDADVKVFLEASLAERAARRRRQEAEAGRVARDIAAVQQDIARRDEQDMTRPDSPLVKPDDAVVLDTTGRSVEEVVGEIVSLAKASR